MFLCGGGFSVGCPRAPGVALGLDLFFADLLADLVVFGDAFFGELDPLHRDCFLVRDWPLFGQHEFVLLFADVGPRLGLVTVGVPPLRPGLLQAQSDSGLPPKGGTDRGQHKSDPGPRHLRADER